MDQSKERAMSDERNAKSVKEYERELAELKRRLSVKLEILKNVPEGIDFAILKSPRPDIEILHTQETLSAEINRLKACKKEADGINEFFKDAMELVTQAQSSLRAQDQKRDVRAAEAAKKAVGDFHETYENLININDAQALIPECTSVLLEQLLIQDKDKKVLRHLNKEEIALWKAAFDQQNSWNPFGSTDKILQARKLLYDCVITTKMHLLSEQEKHSGLAIQKQLKVAEDLLSDLSTARDSAQEYQKEIGQMIQKRETSLVAVQEQLNRAIPSVEPTPVASSALPATSVLSPVSNSSIISEEKSHLDKLLKKMSAGLDKLWKFCKSLTPSFGSSLLTGLSFSLDKKARPSSSHVLEMDSQNLSNPTFEPSAVQDRNLQSGSPPSKKGKTS
jgi:hypothetical protein